MPPGLLLLLGLACGDSPDADMPGDADGDGLTAAEDCDDTDPGVGGPASWYPDLDGDGWGSDAPIAACEPPGGFAGQGGDCDDGDPGVHPGAEEICNGRDDDCDGEVDEVDADGDGHAPVACGGDDCDDAEAAVAPGLEEICGDGLDNDCDGGPGPCAWSGSVDARSADVRLDGAVPGGEAGKALAGAGDLDGDGVADLLVGSWLASAGGGFEGLVRVVRGPAADGVLDAAHATLAGERDGDHFGRALAGLGDLDGDGTLEIAVGAPEAGGAAGAAGGIAYLFHAPGPGTTAAADAAAVLEGSEAGDDAGAALVGGGDLDGDGLPDLVVGAPRALDGAGRVHVWTTTPSGRTDLADAPVEVAGEGGDADAGTALALGDLDGDGVADLAVGASGDGTWAPYAGAVGIFLGPLLTDRTLGEADATLRTGDDAAYLGVSLGAGDVDGDGLDDLLCGAHGWSEWRGAAFLALAPFSGERDVLDAAVPLEGEAPGDYAGIAVALGDLDGDGRADPVVGASGADAAGGGAGLAYLLYGPVEGTVMLGASDLRVSGPEAGAELGAAAAYLGAVLGGEGEVLGLGAPGAVDGAGAAFLFGGGGI